MPNFGIKNTMRVSTWIVLLIMGSTSLHSAEPDDSKLVIAVAGKTKTVIVVSPNAGNFEKRAAADLAKYIGLICGDRPKIANTRKTIDAALTGKQPVLVVGQETFIAKPVLRDAVNAVLKKPILQSDSIVLRRDGNRVYIAGNNDRSHYFAVAELLRRWGCRWYMPTEFGECIPELPILTVGDLDYTFSSPFEIRTYWISWIGDSVEVGSFYSGVLVGGQAASKTVTRGSNPRTVAIADVARNRKAPVL